MSRRRRLAPVRLRSDATLPEIVRALNAFTQAIAEHLNDTVIATGDKVQTIPRNWTTLADENQVLAGPVTVATNKTWAVETGATVVVV